LYIKLKYGYDYLADHGIQIDDEFLTAGAHLLVFMQTQKNKPMTEAEFEYTRQIIRWRIHVERAIERLKIFKLLKKRIPINILASIDETVFACARMCNLKEPLAKFATSVFDDINISTAF